jgi:hypothetical protein
MISDTLQVGTGIIEDGRAPSLRSGLHKKRRTLFECAFAFALPHL